MKLRVTSQSPRILTTRTGWRGRMRWRRCRPARPASKSRSTTCAGPPGKRTLAEVAAALEVLYGIDTGIKMENLTHLARYVEDLTGARLAANHPITGTRAFEYAEEAMAEEELYAPVHKSVNPELFGNEAYWVLGRYSGIDAIDQLDKELQSRGIKLESAELTSVLNRLRSDMESRGRAVTPSELADEALFAIGSKSRIA